VVNIHEYAKARRCPNSVFSTRTVTNSEMTIQLNLNHNAHLLFSRLPFLLLYFIIIILLLY